MNSNKTRCLILLSLSWLVPAVHAYEVPGFTPDQVIEYKQTVNSSGGAVSLHLDVFTPPGHQNSDSRPAIIFFFGGGWVGGSPSQFHPHCEYLASRGMVAISAEYRTRDPHGTTPQECVKDGKSAIRYLRENAATLGIDPNRIAAGGGSAGGHLAAATGTLSAYEEPGENLTISSKPNALILFNPVYDNGPTGYGYSTVQAYWEDISPLHNISATTPPTAVLLGTEDVYIPVSTAKTYQSLMEAAGVRSDLHLYEGQPHGFFNYRVPNEGSAYQANVFQMDEFLVSLGYLTDPHEAPTGVKDWVTIFGDAGFAGGSEATASPVTTDADGDAIAANMPPVSLADGDFLQLSGSVSLDAPLTSGNLRIGLFHSDGPVTAGEGTGFVGIWSEAPGTTSANVVAGDGTGASHPFEASTGTVLGPVPAAGTTVPANTPVDFMLMIARIGDKLDITTRFSDGGTYLQEQNLVSQAVADYVYDSVAILTSENLNAAQAAFSNIEVRSGRVTPGPSLISRVAVADSTIRSSPSNLGTSPLLLIGDTITPDDYLRGVLSFDLNEPQLAGAIITRATLTLFVDDRDTSSGGSADAPSTISIHELLSPFTNEGVSWFSRDGSNDWDTPGGDYGGVLASLTTNAGTVNSGDKLTFTSAALMSAAESAIGGTLDLLVKLETEDATRSVFRLASQNNSNVSYRPTLSIEYEMPGAAATTLGLSGFSYNPADGISQVSIQGAPGGRYKLVEASDLDFSTPDQDPLPLTAASVGTLDGNVVILDGAGHTTVQFNLGTSEPATFIRAEESP